MPIYLFYFNMKTTVCTEEKAKIFISIAKNSRSVHNGPPGIMLIKLNSLSCCSLIKKSPRTEVRGLALQVGNRLVSVAPGHGDLLTITLAAIDKTTCGDHIHRKKSEKLNLRSFKLCLHILLLLSQLAATCSIIVRIDSVRVSPSTRMPSRVSHQAVTVNSVPKLV